MTEELENVDNGSQNNGDGVVIPDGNTESPEEVVITIGEEAPAEEEEQSQSAPDWVKEVRNQNRELKKQKRELEEKLRTYAVVETPKLGEKPALEDFDYDTTPYEEALTKWFAEKRKVDDEAQIIEQKKREETTNWNNRLENYNEAKSELKVSDYDDAEETVRELLSQTQQGIIIQASDKPELLVYALGKNLKKAKELAAITDPVKFTFELAKLEAQMKISNKKSPPPPEKSISGGSAPTGISNSKLESLRAAAAKTGDYTAVIKYKQQMKKNA